MSWEKHNGRGEAHAKKDSVRIGVREDAGGRHALKLSIGRDVVKKMGLSPSARVDFFWGEGNHEGWVRIAHAETGKYAMHLHRSSQGEKASLMMVVGCLPSWVLREKRPSVITRFTINLDKELEVKLPADFLANYDKKRPDLNIGRPKSNGVSKSTDLSPLSPENGA